VTDRTDTLEEVTVSASRKVQLSDYEPFEAYVSETHSVPDDVDYDGWLEARQDDVTAAVEQAAMRRYEEYLREEDFADD